MPIKGGKHTQSTKDKMSASAMGHIVTQATRTKISIGHKGKVVNQSTIAKLSANASGKNNPNYGLEVKQSTIDKRRVSSAATKKNNCRVSVDNINFYSFVMFAKTFGVTGFHQATTITLTGTPSPRQLSDIRERNHHKITYTP